jgi:Domain of unknown function (DUF4203)
MTTDSFFALAVSSMIALFFGTVLAFAGYRFFLVLLPIFGFLFGFVLGAQTVQALFGEGFLATLTGWLAGFIVAVVFAVSSYFFYIAAVGLLGFALGYALATGLLMAFGLDLGFLVWLVGIVAGMVVGAGVVLLNIQKYVVIVATALLGAGVIVGTFLFLFGGLPPAELTQNPVRHVLQTSPFWMLVFLAVAALGAVAQFVSTRRWEVDTYNRWVGLSEPDLTPAGTSVTSS